MKSIYFTIFQKKKQFLNQINTKLWISQHSKMLGVINLLWLSNLYSIHINTLRNSKIWANQLAHVPKNLLGKRYKIKSIRSLNNSKFSKMPYYNNNSNNKICRHSSWFHNKICLFNSSRINFLSCSNNNKHSSHNKILSSKLFTLSRDKINSKCQGRRIQINWDLEYKISHKAISI